MQKCKTCDKTDKLEFKEVIFQDGSKHAESNCIRCGKFVKYLNMFERAEVQAKLIPSNRNTKLF